uniref:Keratin n=1 Tax=Gopherus agassizii TaxID=38772 RepID=A0A452GJG9_9SAUR
MSFNGVPCNDQCHNPCEVTCPQPIVNSSNQPCVVSCGDSRVVFYPPPVVETFPGPILSTCPQDSIVGSSAPSGSRISGSVSMISSTPGCENFKGGFSSLGKMGEFNASLTSVFLIKEKPKSLLTLHFLPLAQEGYGL